jgi:monovalent cation:H+ antiporter-2, CPA2 family
MRRIDSRARAHADTAAAVVVTMDDAAAVEKIVQEVRGLFLELPIDAPARDAAQALRLTAAGATVAAPEASAASLQLGGRALAGFGIGEDAVNRLIDQPRAAESPTAPPANPPSPSPLKGCQW